MKSTGIVRKVDDLGRIVIPKEIRKSQNIEPSCPMEIYTNEDTIMIKKYTAGEACILCGEITDNMHKYKDRNVCENCLNDLQKDNFQEGV
jgi:transcriptional pleiotropic regulator of transition state genes